MVAATRKLVELSFLAMQDAGIEYRGKKVGSFMCGTSAEYWTSVSILCPHPSRLLGMPDLFFPQESMGERTVATLPNTLANRISYILGLNGPSLYLDTACSSSFTAFHLALNSINGGECEAALVGGCQLNTKSVRLVDEC